MKTPRILRLVTLLLLCVFAGCNDSLDRRTTLTFVGDSLIARWDLQSYFSSLITYNKGVSGARIDYIESLAGTMKGRNIVVMIGTNDNQSFWYDEDLNVYVPRYMAAINGLGADRIYLYEVLPREVKGQNREVNRVIKSFNKAVADAIAYYPQIVYMPVYDDFMGKDGHIMEEYYNDGLHLSSEGYEILAGALFRHIH